MCVVSLSGWTYCCYHVTSKQKMLQRVNKFARKTCLYRIRNISLLLTNELWFFGGGKCIILWKSIGRLACLFYIVIYKFSSGTLRLIKIRDLADVSSEGHPRMDFSLGRVKYTFGSSAALMNFPDPWTSFPN